MTADPFAVSQRREFLKAAGAVTVLGLTNTAMAAPGGRISILGDGSDPVASSAPVKRAAERLRKALAGKGLNCTIVQSTAQAKGSTSCIVVAASGSSAAKGFPQAKNEMTSESVRLAPGNLEGAPAILVSGIDQLGLIYGLLELAERVQFGSDPGAGLHLAEAVEEKPANEVRCVSRYFCS